MDAQERRRGVAKCLEQTQGPVSATVLAKKFSVSRQIIVGDVALLRAGGMEISATPRGYVLPAPAAGMKYTIACRHTAAQMERELNAIVDQGCTVVDVIVEHPVYGQITGPLQLTSRYDVAQFVRLVAEQGATPLSALTDGIHLHTILCPDEAAFDRVKESLKQLGMLPEE
ncbi:MAG: transcription repressor NadR [Oscillospiraceae bacterium]|nr:transcription repressor NadR [Oscillospiraceae bacterium]